ncbi:hypothetical protein Emed_000464 [Eimeria media]
MREDELGLLEWTSSPVGEEEETVAILAESMKRAAEEFEKSREGFLSFYSPPLPPSTVLPIGPTFPDTPSSSSLPELPFREVHHASVSRTHAEQMTAVTESSIQSTHSQSLQHPGLTRFPSVPHSSQGLYTSAHASIFPVVSEAPVAASLRQAVAERVRGRASVFGLSGERKRRGEQLEGFGGGKVPKRQHTRVTTDLEASLKHHPRGNKARWVPRAKKSIAEIIQLELSVPAGQESLVSSPSSWLALTQQAGGPPALASGDASRPSTSREVPAASGEGGPGTPVPPDASTPSVAVTMLSGVVIRIHHPPPAMAAGTHVYYRLPHTVPEGGLRPFDANVAFFSSRRARFLCDNMAVIRRLYRKSSLNETESQLLISLGERVVNYLFCLHQASPNEVSPFRACELLGVRYMCFDFLVSLIQLFGPAANPQAWFPQIVAKIPTDFTRMLGPKAGRGKHFACLAYRLSAALRLLKQGLRPTAQVTIMLKRDIFRLDSGPGFFRLKEWDSWREDGKNL